MNKERFVATLERWKKVFKVGAVVSSVVFGVMFVILFAWEAIAPGTAPMWMVWTFIIETLFPYLFGSAYFVNWLITKTYMENAPKT